MRDTIIIRAKFSSRDDAEEARQRLEYAGFAHNSINSRELVMITS